MHVNGICCFSVRCCNFAGCKSGKYSILHDLENTGWFYCVSALIVRFDLYEGYSLRYLMTILTDNMLYCSHWGKRCWYVVSDYTWLCYLHLCCFFFNFSAMKCFNNNNITEKYRIVPSRFLFVPTTIIVYRCDRTSQVHSIIEDLIMAENIGPICIFRSSNSFHWNTLQYPDTGLCAHAEHVEEGLRMKNELNAILRS